ncbi:MAG: glutamate ABC transporter substrate-binding protein [Mycolicibacterium rufum]|uniref:ABC transporter glutamine-binding protein GlnH n=1 Tax=Mycolicibacterium chlorophenolicum TaxID=37916 RepID=A0A0J6VHF1_9MYCO|nr:glutamate ABC transporter substrate-binding protein [Mycolicibacterium chlorophenolicum]KMO70445.1 ABC transporter glutamine-binding protein GlnH precursor [Mycolicibacterium chlorophenolicum]MBI5341532.1 glutamate ABC transporter substrate-binding protein [Mycolicibacterium rufum]
MRTIAAVLVVVSVLVGSCATVRPLTDVAASLTTLPMPSGAEVAPSVSGAAVESCDATASLRPSSEPEPTVDALRRRGRVVVGIDQNSNPLSFRDPITGELEGFLVDLSREVVRDLVGDPAKADFRLVAEPDRIPAVQNETVDILTKATTITCPRAEQIAFSTVYFEGSQRLLVPRGSPVREPADLAGKRICSGLATTSIATVARVAPAATILGVPNMDDCLVALQQGQADAASTDDVLLAGMVAQDPNLEIVGPPLESEPYGIGMNKSQDDLVRAVNASLNRIRGDGTWVALYRKWLTALGPPPTPPEPKYRD